MFCSSGSLPGPELFFLFALSLQRVLMSPRRQAQSPVPAARRRRRPAKKQEPVLRQKPRKSAGKGKKPKKKLPAVAKNVDMRPLAAPAPRASGQLMLARSPSQAPRLSNLANRLYDSRVGADAGVGRMNKVGSGLERIQMDHKNLRADPPAEAGVSRAQRWLEKNMSPKDLLSPDAQRYVALLDEPLNAPWGDAGEVSVRPLVYTETVPPSTTKTVRCFGQTRIVIEAGSSAWVACCVGAGNIVSGDDEDGDDLQYAWPNLFPSPGGPPSPDALLVTLGAPNDDRTAANAAGGGVGAFGYWYEETAANAAPIISTSDVAPAAGVRRPLIWGSPVPLGEMTPGDSSQYKYRPVAGGLLITPDDTTFNVGGHFDAMVIPQGTNAPYVASPPTQPGLGTAVTDAEIFALPDHCIQRGDSSISVNWLPGRMDYAFLQTQTQAEATTPGFVGACRVAPNVRMWVRISPPPDASHSFVLSYTGFYEVAGRSVQQVGSVPRPQPSLGAKIATSVQNNLNIELDDRSRQVTEGATLEVMKDHPKIGPMVEDCKSMPEARSALDEIVDFGKELLPLVGLLL
jgi:hypothetical protein